MSICRAHESTQLQQRSVVSGEQICFQVLHKMFKVNSWMSQISSNSVFQTVGPTIEKAWLFNRC